MPCYTRSTITIQRKVKNFEALKRVLDKLQMTHAENTESITTSNGMIFQKDGIEFNRRDGELVNTIMSHYGREVVVEWAEDHGLVVEEENEFEFSLVSY